MRWKAHKKLKQTHGLHSKSRLSPNPTSVNQPTVLEMRYFGVDLVTSRHDINPCTDDRQLYAFHEGFLTRGIHNVILKASCKLTLEHERVAQLVEHRPFKALVLGSSPSPLTTNPLF